MDAPADGVFPEAVIVVVDVHQLWKELLQHWHSVQVVLCIEGRSGDEELDRVPFPVLLHRRHILRKVHHTLPCSTTHGQLAVRPFSKSI